MRTRSQVFDEGDVVEVPNYQFFIPLYYITKPLNRQIEPYAWISIDYQSLGRLVFLVYFARLAFQAYSALAQRPGLWRSKGRMPNAVPVAVRTLGRVV